jgi:lipoprotein-anchoring transpeptidase ErfK/SrfK
MLLTAASHANADSRNNAWAAIANLNQGGMAYKFPDEMTSIESTYFAAEQFRLHNYLEMAERYYLLAIQKASILLAAPPRHSPDAPASLSPDTDSLTPDPEATESGAPIESPANTPALLLKPAEKTPPTSESESVPEGEYLPDEIESDKLVGHASIYSVGKRETLQLIAAKLGVSRQHLARMNGIDPKEALRVGQKLKYNNRKIVPQHLANGIIINIPDRTLYYFRSGKLATALPVAVGTARKDSNHDWKTPTGKFIITAKVKDPTWYVPLSIQAKMEEEGKDVITIIPPGPGNPLGKYAIKTSLPGILIHSTTRPGSIYSYASHGCIRIYPEHMEQFFKEISVNTRGEIIYHPVKLAITENGRIYLEVHRDAYGKSAGLHALASQLIEKRKLSKRVNWDKVGSVVNHKAGFAEDITL